MSGDFGKEDLKVPNSVLTNHLEKEGLLELLSDRQDIEEHLFEMGLCSLKCWTTLCLTEEGGERCKA